MVEINKKSHWYLAHVNWSLEYNNRTITGEGGRVFSSETQNISSSKLEGLQEVIKSDLFESHGQGIERPQISIVSLSYLGFMTENEFDQ